MAKLKEKAAPPADMRGSNTMMQLLSFVERYERLQEERDALGDDQKEVMAEAKDLGFDTAIIRKVISRRKQDAASREETDVLLETYEEAIRLAEKQQVKESVEAAAPAEPPKPSKLKWGKKLAQQTDIEELAPAVVQEQAAKEIAHAADHPGDDIPSFLRRKKA